jgi:uncharacterized protein involved in outer membrane biogenesis
MPHVRVLLASRSVRAGLLVLAAVGLYAFLGYSVAPGLVRTEAAEFVRERYGRELQLGVVRIDPFRLHFEARDFALPDADGAGLVSFRRLFVDLELASLWHRAWVLDRVRLEAPAVRAVLRHDGRLNLADLALPDDGAVEEPLPAVWVRAFELEGGAFDWRDESGEAPLERQFAPVSFRLEDFRTTREGGGFSLRARSRQDEGIQWQGHFALEPHVASSGTFTVTDLRASGVAELLGDALPFEVPRGKVNIAGEYDFALLDAPALDLRLPRVELAGLALRARGIEEEWVTAQSLVLADTTVELPAQSVRIGQVRVEGLDANVWMNADGTLNLEQLFATPTRPSPEATVDAGAPRTSGTSTEAAATPDPAAAWTLAVDAVTLAQGSVALEDRTVRPAARFVLSPLDVTVRNASLDLGRPLPVEFATGLNQGARVSGHGEIVPASFAAALDVALDRFALRDLQPYATGATDLTIRAGTLATRGRLTLGPAGSGNPVFAYAGDLAIAGFRSVDNALGQDFLNFERVELTGLAYAMSPDALAIDRVRVVGPYARVIVASNGVTNVAAVFDPAGSAAAAAAAAAAGAEREARARATAVRKTRAEKRADRKAAQEAAAARRMAAAAPAPELHETGMPIRIGEVTIARGTMEFADYSIEPNFAATVQSLGGRVQGLSSDPNSHAQVELAGNVGEFSPVRITGRMQPFAYDRHTDIGLRFENIALPIFNPYSGRFAGYNIASGKLTTELHYTIEARRLDAQHKVRIDQLEWGDATPTRAEATLPVKFATSLLKDADGVIELDVPVQGTLDDPTFRIGPIVWQIVKNILSKAVTAPFRALGALFQGAEEAQFVDFAPGSATLDPVAAERLGALGRSLVPKEDLRLDVPLAAEATADGAALASQRYERELAEAVRTVLQGGRRRAADDQASPPSATLEPGQQRKVLAALYERLAGAAPVVPAEPEPAGDESRRDRQARALAAELAWLEAECRRLAPAEPAALERLAQERAEAVQRAVLTETGLAPARVFVVRNGKVAAHEAGVRLELSVE